MGLMAQPRGGAGRAGQGQTPGPQQGFGPCPSRLQGAWNNFQQLDDVYLAEITQAENRRSKEEAAEREAS